LVIAVLKSSFQIVVELAKIVARYIEIEKTINVMIVENLKYHLNLKRGLVDFVKTNAVTPIRSATSVTSNMLKGKFQKIESFFYKLNN
jgi:hypothetical protein